MTSKSSPQKVGFVSLGCPKATVDSEHILTRLRAEGYLISGSYQDADLVVVNTCGFIDSAVEESLDAIGEALAENGRVIVTGCLGAKGDVVKQAHPSVLAVTGPHATDEVMAAVHQHLPKPHDPYMDLVPPQGIRLTPKHYAYVKISEGCNHRCTFCIIPSLRGDLVSRPVGDVMQEAQKPGQRGRQGTAGDLAGHLRLWGGHQIPHRLLGRQAAQEPHDRTGSGDGRAWASWVRLHYVYPYPHVDEVIPLMAQGRILPYLDIPFQHASQRILKLMKRPASSENVLARIRQWRETCPDLTLRSTFIVGFPGETEEEFEELLDFLEEAQLDRVGAFAYSPVDGAAANALPDHIPPEVQQERLARLMLLQEEISAERLKRKIGKTITVLVDEVNEEGAIARSSADAPDIDGLVYIESGRQLCVGDFVEVKITDSDEHDLWGETVSSAECN